MHCKQYSAERLDEYLAGVLSPRASKLVQQHSRACAECRAKISELEGLRQQLKKLSCAVPPAPALERLLRTAIERPAPATIGFAGSAPVPECTILCVDDEPQVLKGLARHLGRRYEVLTATEGTEALRLLECNHAVAVIISDMRMPRMDGATLLARARCLAPAATRLLLTGYSDAEAATRAINDGGIDRLLVKPCKPEELMAAVDKGVERYRAARVTQDTLRQQLESNLDIQYWSVPLDRELCPASNLRGSDQEQLMLELPEAMRRDALEVYYQPVVDFRQRSVRAFEALPVWNHPAFGHVTAAQLRPLAQESDNIRGLDEWLLRRACSEARQLLGGECPRLVINLSDAAFHGRRFSAQLKQTLLAHGLPPHEIELRLPDSVFREDPASVVPVLQTLRARGHRVAAGSLESGYSSLLSWEALPIDRLSVSAALVPKSHSRSAGVIRAALAFGQSLGVEVVIDDVQSEQTLGWLLDCGASTVQGAAIAAPATLQAVKSWLREFRSTTVPDSVSTLARAGQ